MKVGANLHHSSVSKVLNPEPINEFIAAKTAFAQKDGSSHSLMENQIDFPTLQDARDQSYRSKQLDLAFITPPSTPCSPQVANLPAASSSASQRSLALMQLSPPLMEKLEADLVLLQKKYGLGSQALTPARIPHQDASAVQANLLSSKLAAMETFVSPLRQIKVSPPSDLGTEAPLAILAKDSTYRISECAITVRGKAPLNPSVQFLENPLSTNSTEHARGSAPPSAWNCSVNTPTVSGNAPSTVRGNAPILVRGNGSPTVTGNPQGSAQMSAPSTGQNCLAFPPMGRGNVPPNVRENGPITDRGNPRVAVRGNAPPIAQNCIVYAQNGTAPDRGNVPLYNSASQCTEPVRGTSWAARLGGSRSTSSTPLSYIPPTLVAGHSGAMQAFSDKMGLKWHFRE